MLQQCALDELPGWARAEFMAMGCILPKKWFVRNQNTRFIPLYGFSSTEELPGPTPSQPESGRWILETSMIVSKTFPEHTNISDWSESGVYRRTSYSDITIYEPGFAFVARLTLQRPAPEDRNLHPTPYPVVRIQNSSPLFWYDNQTNRQDMDEISSGGTYKLAYSRYYSAKTLQEGLESAELLYWVHAHAQHPEFPHNNAAFNMPEVFLPPSTILYVDKLRELTYIERRQRGSTIINGNVVNEWDDTDTLRDHDLTNFEQSLIGGNMEFVPQIFEIIDELDKGFIKTRNRATVSLIKKLHKGPVDIGIMLAEMKSTSQMVYGRLHQLVSALDAVRKRNPVALGKALTLQPRLSHKSGPRPLPLGNIPRVQKRTRKFRSNPSSDPASLFLEYNFGWKQLYNDVNGLMQVLLTDMYKLGQPIHVTAYEVSDNRIGNYITGRPPQGGRTEKSYFKLIPKGIRRNEVSGVLEDVYDYRLTMTMAHQEPIVVMNAVRIKANYKVKDVKEKLLQSLGIKNPFVAMWDFVPYSFIADWVLNLDAIIKKVSYDAGLVELPSTMTSFWYVPLVASIYDGNRPPDDRWVQYPKTVGTVRFSMRSPVRLSEWTGNLSVGDIVSTASAPTRLFQMGTLSAMAIQRLLRR